MESIQSLLQVSAKLYQHLTNVSEASERDKYIEEINILLDERGIITEKLKQEGFTFDPSNRTHVMLKELDMGIQERLKNVMSAVKEDLKTLQNSKKNEKQYLNPYASVQVMDGRYYDKKN